MTDANTLRKWDEQYVWHPFTPHSVYADELPLMIERGEGHELIDIEGNRYLDGVASIWCNTFGHRRKEIDEAIIEQLGKVAHATMLGNANVPAVELAHRLVQLAPAGLQKVFYSDNGSTSVEIALKMAYQYWQQKDDGAYASKSRFLAFGNAYNGDTVGAVSVGGIDIFHERFRPLLFETLRAPSPYAYRCDLCKEQSGCANRCLEVFEAMVREHHNELAAVVIEPGMQGAGGIIVLPDGFLEAVRRITADHNVLLICDEVAVGMGRCGAMFACEKHGISPDFLCIAKGLTAGYLPLAATLTTDEVFEAFLGPPHEGRTFFHGHTYTGNPLGCAAALATLDIFESDDILASMAPRIEYLHSRLSSLRDHPYIGDVRCYGLCAGVELVRDPVLGTPFAADERVGARVCMEAKRQGVFLRPLSDVIVFMPPLTITEPEIDRMIEAMLVGIERVLG